MSLKLEDVISLDDRPRGAAQAIRRKSTVARPSRRDFLRGAAALAMTLGVTALNWVPSARRAWAQQGYEIFPDGALGPCQQSDSPPPPPGFSFYARGHDAIGCTNRPCSNCCVTVPSTWRNYHRGDHYQSRSTWYYLRWDECWQGATGRYDGWLWNSSPIGRVRCHDGWTCQPDNSNPETINLALCTASICRAPA